MPVTLLIFGAAVVFGPVEAFGYAAAGSLHPADRPDDRPRRAPRRHRRGARAPATRRPRPPLVLLGDLNEWFLWDRPVRWLHAHFGHTPSPPTFPSGLPVLALDRIWTEPREACTALGVHRTPLARVASDHLPLVARVDWTVRASRATGERDEMAR